MTYKLLLATVAFVFCFSACKKEPVIQLNYSRGNAFGTTYSVQFISKTKQNFSKQYDSLVTVINQSMSTYQEDSDISKINKGDTTVTVDEHFEKVFKRTTEIYKKTKGAFDPTIGVLVNAWDFGPKGEVQQLDSLKVDSLLQIVGWNKLQLVNRRIQKETPTTFLDFNALAKGYAVDVFAEFLESKGATDYLVEIGGEIRGKGKNLIKNKSWRIGVENPNFDASQSYSKTLPLVNAAMATSGSYRKFKVDAQGNRYAHIINAKTGYPLKSNLLSVSVIAEDCMTADAYATTFMAMGLEASKTFLKNHTSLKVYFIFENDQKELETLAVNGFPE